MTAVEFMVKEISEILGPLKTEGMTDLLLLDAYKQAKEMEKEQKGYSEEDVREMLFMALYEPQEECCTTHTKDSIVRKVLKSFKTQ
jgi:hypothetical protein